MKLRSPDEYAATAASRLLSKWGHEPQLPQIDDSNPFYGLKRSRKEKFPHRFALAAFSRHRQRWRPERLLAQFGGKTGR